MAKISFIGNWSAEWQKLYEVPKGFLLVKPQQSYIKAIGEGLKKLNADQVKKSALRDMDVTFDIHYMKRTMDQNALLWALYEVEANEMNGGQSGKADHNVTAEEIYDNDLKEYAPRIEMFVGAGEYHWIKTEYRLIEVEKYDKARDKYYLKVIVTTSHFNTIQMANWINRIFNRVASVGVINGNDIRNYWLKWRNHLNTEKIVLHEDLTEDEYRANNLICEACGSGQGLQLAHIRAGHHPEEHKAWNWLILCNDCHTGIQHSKGFSELLKIAPHLKNKIENALKKLLENF
jgi:hypothetical protein